MSNKVGFSLSNIDSIPRLFESGIIEYFVGRKQDNRPNFIWMRTGNNAVVRICSTINEFDDWDEIGSLCFELVEESSSNNDMVSLDTSWLKVKKISKLVLIDEHVNVECGLKIVNENLQFIIILPSSFPNAIEMKSDFYLGDFEPECSIDVYSCLPFKQK